MHKLVVKAIEWVKNGYRRTTHTSVETLKATKGATWLLEQLQSLVITSAKAKQLQPDIKPPTIITSQEEQEREELARMSQHGMQLAYSDDEYEYS